jgi:tripartite-type tricarboxylate transporter receptor subunit TctC
MKIILCILMLTVYPVKAEESLKLLMSVSPTVNLISKHLNLPVSNIMLENKDGGPLLRAGESNENSLVLTGSTAFIEYSLFHLPEEDILNQLTPIAYLGEISFALVTSTKTLYSLQDIVDIAKKENRSVTLGGNGFNNICHMSTVFLTKKYNVPFEFIEYKKTPQLDADVYNKLVDVSCKFSFSIEDEARRKYYRIIANFSKNDNTGSLKDVLTFDDLPNLTSSFVLFAHNINTKTTEEIKSILNKVGESEYLKKNHIFININTDKSFITNNIIDRRISMYDIIKNSDIFSKKLKNIPSKEIR